MRTGREAGRADIADDLALADARAWGDAIGDGVLVRVRGFIAVGVFDDGLVAIAIGPAGLFDYAAARSDDRRAARGGPVDAGMSFI